MIDLKDIRYVRLGTRNVDEAAAYAQKILGLELVRKENGACYFRSDDRDHTLVYFEGAPTDNTIAFELAGKAELDAAASALSDAGYQVEAGSREGAQQRCVEDFINFKDPTGNSVDLVMRPHHSGRRYFPSRDAGINGFSHVGLRTSDPGRDEKFWTQLMSARVSDRIGGAPLLRIDGVHHKIALFPSATPGVQHINHQVDDINDLMRSYYMLKEQGIKIVFGPGRHPTSGAVFLYFEGPDGMVYEYSTGVKVFTEEEMKTHEPRQFPFTAASFCMWGSKPDIPEFRK